MSNLTREEVIQRLCILCSEVGHVAYKDDQAHDCFCNEVVTDPGNFRFDEVVMDFIEGATRRAIFDKTLICGRAADTL
jgi:hypothetical protein